MATPLFTASGMDEHSAKLFSVPLPCELVVCERLRREGVLASMSPRLERSRQGYPSAGGKEEALNRN
jgi:hypothetical protein